MSFCMQLHLPVTTCRITSALLKKYVLPGFIRDLFEFFEPFNQDVQEAIFHELRTDFVSLKYLTAFWAFHIVSYLECRDSFGVDFYPLRYEDLLERPDDVLRRLFRHCKMSADVVDDCLTGKENDFRKSNVRAFAALR